MSSGLKDEDKILASKIITLVHDLDAIAVERRLADNDAARNCADAARSLRQWLDENGLAPNTEPLA
jgi:hypothetical protein